MKAQLKLYNIFMILFFACSFLPASSQEYPQKTNLPTFYITTDDGQPVTDKETWKPGRITVKSSNSFEEINMNMEIRARGNSTLNMPKTAYRMKLNTKTRLLGLPASEKNWVLLANYADKTLIRNAVAMEISKLVGLEFTPAVRFVDVVFNGIYRGNYMVTDQVEVNAGRVPVEKQESDSAEQPLITGGYLLELDGFAYLEKEWFQTAKGMNVTIKYPKDDEINDAQRNYITNYIADVESRLFSSDFTDDELGYKAKVDTTSLVNWYIACELTGNSDSFWQTYLYKKRNDDKLYFGPLWDYDIAFNNDQRLADRDGNGNYIVESAVKKLMREKAHAPLTWIKRFWEDYWFREAVERRWIELTEAGLLEHLLAYIDETAELIDESQRLNFQYWNILDRRVYQEVVLFSTYEEGINNLKDYITKRVDFLNSSFIIPDDQRPSPPFVVEGRQYKIANIKTGKVLAVQDDLIEEGALLVAWDKKDEEDDAQLWNIIAIDDTYFRITDVSSNLAIAGNGKGQNLKLMPADRSDDTQLWEIVPVGVGEKYGFVNKASGYSINNSGGGTQNGNAIIEYDSKVHQGGSDNQNWYFHKMPIFSTGTQPVEKVESFTVYPNPASGYASARLFSTQAHDTCLFMCDVSGTELFRIDCKPALGEQIISLPVEKLRPGVYFVVLKVKGQHKLTRKLIVN